MSKYSALLLLLLSISSIAHENSQPPHLWSTFKDLDKSVAACKMQGKFEFDRLGIKGVVENAHGIYGIYKGNRVVEKCTAQGNKSRLWVMVAGHDKGSVEIIRNQLAKGII